MIKSIEIRENGVVVTLLGGPREFDVRVRWEDEPVKDTGEKDQTEPASPSFFTTLVPSERQPGVNYEVKWDINGVTSCTCPSFVYRGPCKHFLDPRVTNALFGLRDEVGRGV